MGNRRQARNVRCPSCDKKVPVRKDGQIAQHPGRYRAVCPAVGRNVKQARDLVEV